MNKVKLIKQNQKPTIPDEFNKIVADPDSFEKSLITSRANLISRYQQFKTDVRNGKLGKTAQFWMMYIDLMELQQLAHTSIQTNDYDMRLYAWENILPYYFALNKVNYARYGTCYLETLKQIDIRNPGLKTLLEKRKISVQAQIAYPVRTAIDQRGEQSINRDAKTAGMALVNIQTTENWDVWDIFIRINHSKYQQVSYQKYFSCVKIIFKFSLS